jgi:DNA-directed RNA polymerase II subunit RPB2
VFRNAINHKNGDGKNEEVDPMTCRLRDLNYELSIKAELFFRESRGNEPQESGWQLLEKIKIATLPVMVKSKWCKLDDRNRDASMSEYNECPHDEGGYFIVRGSEKVIVAQ